jgi:Sulfotransferase domain
VIPGRPHFIIIGAMKCATSTLHVQLAQQAGFAMSDPKEPNFFSDDEVFARGLDWYHRVFPTGQIKGESSTHYTKLPTHPHTIRRLRREFGEDLKFIYIMRHPVDRLVSHYIHEWSQGVISEPIENAIHSHEPLVAYGSYARQLRPWLETFGPKCVLPVFFDSIAERPQFELERICRFLKYEGRPTWVAEKGRQNVSRERIRRGWLDTLGSLGPLVWLVRRLVPERNRAWARGFRQMKMRPTLEHSDRAALEALFDEDLAQLGEWLGIPLSCSTFHNLALGAEPKWTDAAPRPKGFLHAATG